MVLNSPRVNIEQYSNMNNVGPSNRFSNDHFSTNQYQSLKQAIPINNSQNRINIHNEQNFPYRPRNHGPDRMENHFEYNGPPVRHDPRIGPNTTNQNPSKGWIPRGMPRGQPMRGFNLFK